MTLLAIVDVINPISLNINLLTESSRAEFELSSIASWLFYWSPSPFLTKLFSQERAFYFSVWFMETLIKLTENFRQNS